MLCQTLSAGATAMAWSARAPLWWRAQLLGLEGGIYLLFTTGFALAAWGRPQKAVAYRFVRILGYRQTEAAERLGVTVRVLAHRLVEPDRRVRRAVEAWRAGRSVGAVRASIGAGDRP